MSDRVREAVRLLLEQARDRVDRHPHGHLLPAAPDALELRLALPLTESDDALSATVERLSDALDRGVEELLAHAAVFAPGRVLCLRDGTTECEHATPTDPRRVFAGYGPTGTPRWVDFGQLLLDRHDPRVEQLYAESGDAPLLTTVLTEEELTGELLPSFRDVRRDVRVHGQVAAGFYRIPDGTGRRQALAVAVQLISTRPKGARPRFGLNVIGRGPDGETLEHLHDRIGAIPWMPAVRWGQSVLNHIAAEARGPHGRGPEVGRGPEAGRGPDDGRGPEAGRGRMSEPALRRRVDGLLGGLARRLARVHRARDRRTLHAEARHDSGERPTRMAVLDLSRANDEAILVDERRRTVVVLGERGRAHVFNGEGKLVTSVRYPPGTIARRRESGIWRRATPEEAAHLRARVVSS